MKISTGNLVKSPISCLVLGAIRTSIFGLAIFLANAVVAQDHPNRALIVDGQNNHGNWPQTTQMMKSYLEQTRLFDVDIATTASSGTDENFAPDFANYDVIVSNYNGAPWPERTQQAFVKYMNSGGGLVVVHAADNAFPEWEEYNKMIGLGGWGGRNHSNGPYVYFDEKKNAVVRDDAEGDGGSHGSQHPFSIIIRNSEHPVTKGMPGGWLHANDELYDRLRGPAENMIVLATAWSDPVNSGSGRHEPILMSIEYGKGRVFHLPLGHGNDSQECVGFITTLQRAAEWAATGEVTQAIPDDFPGLDQPSSRPFENKGQDK